MSNVNFAPVKVNLVNLTPHPLNIHTTDGEVVTLPKCEKPARVDVINKFEGEIRVDDGDSYIPLYMQIIKEYVNLPEPQEGTIYIVSLVVRQAANRADVMSPGELKRDEEGRVVGCDGLAHEFVADDYLDDDYMAYLAQESEM